MSAPETLFTDITDAQLLAMIRSNLAVQARNAFKGFNAEFAFESNCALLAEASRRGIINFSIKEPTK